MRIKQSIFQIVVIFYKMILDFFWLFWKIENFIPKFFLS